MPNTVKATPETGETASRKPAPANPGNPSARLAGYSWVKRATTGAGVAVVIGIALVLVGARQDIPALNRSQGGMCICLTQGSGREISQECLGP